MGGAPFRWPAGTYVSDGKFNHIMMAMETSITKNGISYKQVEGTPIEEEELENSYKHLCKLRDEVIEMGIIPAIEYQIISAPKLNVFLTGKSKKLFLHILPHPSRKERFLSGAFMILLCFCRQ